MAPLTPVLRALDTHPIIVAIRAALLANATVAGLVDTRIYPDDDVKGGAFPFLAISVPSDLTANTYSHSAVNDLIQITAVDKPLDALKSTAKVVALGAAAQTALLDTPWSVPGWTLMGVGRESYRPYTDSQNGGVYRYGALTLRVQAMKT